jgi:hypothetical protein
MKAIRNGEPGSSASRNARTADSNSSPSVVTLSVTKNMLPRSQVPGGN